MSCVTSLKENYYLKTIQNFRELLNVPREDVTCGKT